MVVFVALPDAKEDYLNVADLTVSGDDDIVVKPGWNTWILKGKVLPLVIIGKSDPRMDYFFTEFVTGRGINARVECIETHVQNGLEVTWLNSTIKSLVMESVAMPGLDAVKRQNLIKSLSPTYLNMTFRPDSAPTDLSVDCVSGLEIEMEMPFPNIKMKIIKSQMKNQLMTSEGRAFATLESTGGWQDSESLSDTLTFIPIMTGRLSIITDESEEVHKYK